MGGDDMFRAMDICLRHKCISFPGHQHADLYDISKTPMAVEQRLLQLGVSICRQARVTGADMSGDNTTVLSVTTGATGMKPMGSLTPREPPGP